MLAGIAAGILFLAAPKALVEATRATDSSSRDRGAYALARSFDPSDESANNLVRALLERGETDQRAAIRRGLMARAWPGGRPQWLESMMNDAPSRRLGPTFEAFLVMPREDGVQFVLRQIRENGVMAGGVTLAPMLDDDRLREPLKEQHRLRGTGQLFFQGKCTLEECRNTLCELAWLGEDLSPFYARYEGKEFLPTDENVVLLASIKACAKGSSDADLLRKASHTWIDPVWRARLLEYLFSLPGTPRPDAIAAAADAAHDLDGHVRSRAVQLLSVVAGRSNDSNISNALVYSLKDTNPDVRVEAAAGLLEMRAGAAEMAALRATETDLAVRGLLELSGTP